MAWIQLHWAEVLAIGAIILRLMESVAALTPTDKDNKWIAIVKEFFRFG